MAGPAPALGLDVPPAMHWWKSPGPNSPSPSSSSSSPKSAPTSPAKQKRGSGAAFRDIALFRSRRDAQPRLTRQRRLRQPGDLLVDGPVAPSSENSTPVSSSSAARSPTGDRVSSSARASSPSSPSVMPLPLPLPDLAALLRKGSGVSESRGRLPSPREVPGFSRDEGDAARNSFAGDGKEKAKISPSGSRFVSQFTRRGPEHVSGLSSASTLVEESKVLRDPKTAEKVQSFRLNVPARSAPSSNLSSPVQSPRRMSTGDFFPPSYADSHGLQFWSAPEIPSSGVTTSGFSSRTSPEKFSGLSPDWSPLHSPTSKSLFSKSNNLSGETTPLDANFSSESSSWHDHGLVTVHPLPLPPGASLPSQSTFIHHSPAVLEVPSMKSQWQKGKLIGSGTFGNVYVATNKETGALCAMKEVSLIPDDPKSAECMQQLEQEIKVLSQLKHPNIVQYYGSEIVEDRFYIYLEYVHPGSISKYVREHCGAMTESVVRNFTRHILYGLAYLHSKKTIHRDIKGANLLVDASGVVKLADFGMAKHLSGQAAALSLRGSPYWMAPEVMQAMMQKDSGYDLAVDIWSLGCTIIEMFTGKPPWSEYEGAAAMFKVLKNESPPIPTNLSAEGKDFLQLCFRRNPSDRPSASGLLEHRFVRSFSQTQEIPACTHEFSRMKLVDTMVPSTDWNILSRTSEGRYIPNSDTRQSDRDFQIHSGSKSLSMFDA